MLLNFALKCSLKNDFSQTIFAPKITIHHTIIIPFFCYNVFVNNLLSPLYEDNLDTVFFLAQASESICGKFKSLISCDISVQAILATIDQIIPISSNLSWRNNRLTNVFESVQASCFKLLAKNENEFEWPWVTLQKAIDEKIQCYRRCTKNVSAPQMTSR